MEKQMRAERQYLQMLPQPGQGGANRVFVIPSEFTDAFGGIGKALSARADQHREVRPADGA